MTLRGCSSSHYFLRIRGGVVETVHNMDVHGRPSFKFKKLEELYQHADAKYTPLRLAERETREEYEANNLSEKNNHEELTLSQIKKKLKRKKTKALSVLLAPKVEDDDVDLAEPLCKFRVKGSKSSPFKRVSANGNSSTSSTKAQLVTPEINKYFATVKIKVEAPEEEEFESSHDLKRGESELLTNEGEKCEFNEALLDSLDDIKNMEMDDEETIANDSFSKDPTASVSDCSRSQFYFQQTPQRVNSSSVVQDSDLKIDDDHDEDVLSMEAKPPVFEEGIKCELNEAFFESLDDIEDMEMVNEDIAASASECSQSQYYFQQTPEQVNISAVKDSTPTIDEHYEDVVSMEAKLPIFEENKSSTSMTTDADSNSSNSDNSSLVSKGIFICQELISIVPANTDSEVKLDHIDQTGVMSEASEIRQTERLPLTRKFISPNSQEKLCQAMKSADSLDDMEHFKCKEKLYFGEQAENKFLSTKSDVEDNELNLHSQHGTQHIQNKAVISSKQGLKRPRSLKKGSPTKKGIAPKGCLDGPRLCRSLPRLSSGCTSIEGCSESAITFSQRQMHDIESLASKLLSELNSMKTIVEEKMLYEAYRSTSLKNEADEVKSVIKNATKTEETAKKWLSMMARDCNRFCKIMKLNEDHNTSASGDPALENSIPEKPLEREKKKISFADEAGGTLCDIRVYQIEEESSPQ